MSKRGANPRAIGYVRADPSMALADPVSYMSRAPRAQEDAIRTWAAEHRVQLVAMLKEECPPGLDGVSSRTAFATALARVRDGDADSVLLASLDALSEDVLLQELLLHEARMASVPFVSVGADAAQISGDPIPEERAGIRRALDAAPAFQMEMRSLRVRLRHRRNAEDATSMLARIESMEELGATARELGSLVDGFARARRPNRMIDRVRRRRLAGEEAIETLGDA